MSQADWQGFTVLHHVVCCCIRGVQGLFVTAEILRIACLSSVAVLYGRYENNSPPAILCTFIPSNPNTPLLLAASSPPLTRACQPVPSRAWLARASRCPFTAFLFRPYLWTKALLTYPFLRSVTNSGRDLPRRSRRAFGIEPKALQRLHAPPSRALEHGT